MNTKIEIASNLQKIDMCLRDTEEHYGKQLGSVKLVAISKTQPVEKIQILLDLGHRVFGENRVQEAMNKWPNLREQHNDIELHFVGPLQSNKAQQAVKQFDIIETLDRRSLAKELAKTMDKLDKRPDCFIQINTGEESQKAGVFPRDADKFIKSCQEEFELPVTGLMCIPPVAEEPSPHFVFLSQIARRHGLENVSMGMSSDYLVAARFGATHVRIGTAIFGSRQLAGN